MNAKRIFITSLVGVALSLGACDSGKQTEGKAEAGKKDDANKTAEAGKPAAGDDGAVADPGEAPAADDGAAPAEEVAVELDERVEKAVTIAKKIDAEPEKADEILAEAGMDRSSFNALMYEVSAAGLAEQYRFEMAKDAEG